MMKYTTLRIIACVMWIVSKVYPYSLSERLRWFQEILYTMWVSFFIGHVGKHTTISKPCSLQGGGHRRIKIGDYTYFGHHCVMGCWERYVSAEGVEHHEPEIVIGNYCSIGDYCHITACNMIIIGDGLLTGRFVYIGDNAHGGLSWAEADIPPVKRQLTSKGEVIIGKNVWIGDKVTILGGVHIGDNVIVGANAVVTKDIPSNCIVAGCPAKVMKELI